MLWTDGRYLLQAAQELDANRTVTLMQDRVAGTAPISHLILNKMVGKMHAQRLFAALSKFAGEHFFLMA